jgi:DNA-binding response OmpR family regulator
METKLQIQKRIEPVNVLLIGNNPIDMSSILEKLNQIRGAKVITEIAFDLRSILERLMRFKPNYILIDDNIGKAELAQTVNALAQASKTKNIPIAVLKNSNYQESYGAGSILDYLLKANLSADSLYSTIRNSLRFKKTQAYLYKAYSKRRTALRKAYSV